jgi:hypothetical protein
LAKTRLFSPKYIFLQVGIYNTIVGDTKRKRILLEKDSCSTGSKSSMQILLEWVTTEGNYSRWKGGDKHSGKTKESM